MTELNEQFVNDLIATKIKEKFSQEVFILWYILDKKYLIDYVLSLVEITDKQFSIQFVNNTLDKIILSMPTPQANKVTRFLEELAVKMMNIKNTIKSTGEKSW